MYFNEDQVYACSTGCNTPTIDSALPNRGHLYAVQTSTNDSDTSSSSLLSSQVEAAYLSPPMEDTLSYIFSSFFSFGGPVSFDALSEHAESMEMLVVPYLRSDVTILTRDVSLLCPVSPPPPDFNVLFIVVFRGCTAIVNTVLIMEVHVFSVCACSCPVTDKIILILFNTCSTRRIHSIVVCREWLEGGGVTFSVCADRLVPHSGGFV